MAMFQLEVAFLLELALFAGGLALLHLARQGDAPLLRAAGFVLVVGSLLTAACTVYYGVRYHVQGEFDHAYPQHHRMKHPMHGMKHGMKHPGMKPAGPMRHPGPEASMGQMPPEAQRPQGAPHHPEGAPSE